LIWVFTKLPVKVWMVMRIHAALEDLGIDRSIKEPCRDPKRAYAITTGPNFTDGAAL
jgi:hypothetical protein